MMAYYKDDDGRDAYFFFTRVSHFELLSALKQFRNIINNNKHYCLQ